MGDPKKPRKKYKTPNHPWDAQRIIDEKDIIKEYGLKNKKEIWKAQSKIRGYTKVAKNLISTKTNQSEIEKQQILSKLFKYNLLTKDAKIEDILSLDTKNLLERRLQTTVYKKGLTKSINQARQAITHGHVFVDGKKVSVPSYLVSRDEENKITLNPKINFSKEELKKEVEVQKAPELKE